MTWKWIIYGIVFSLPTVFLKDVARMKRSDKDGGLPCEKGWLHFRQKCYKLHSDILKTWNAAAHACTTHGGHLVSINSEEELNFLVTDILMHFKYATWIGLHDKDIESEFSWHDGSPVNYTNWMVGEPSIGAYGDEDCVQMLYNHPLKTESVLGKWNDASCTAEYSYICQKKIVDYCMAKCGNSSDVECAGNKYKEQLLECKCKRVDNAFDEEMKECRVDYCIAMCGNNSDVECAGNKYDEQSVECKCKQVTNVFDKERKECKEDYCLSKCGKNPDLECVGDRFDENDVQCKCHSDGQLFDEEKKECRVDYCLEKCGNDPGLECLNRFNESDIGCKCTSSGYSFDEESKECKVDYCIEKCGKKPDVECIGSRFANRSTILCNCSRNYHWFDEKMKECRDLNIENKDLVSNNSACGKNMKHYDCMPICNTCHVHLKGMLCYVTCKPGCFCKEGYVEKRKGECVLPRQCPNYIGRNHLLYPLIGVSFSLLIVLLILAAVICYFRRKQRFTQSDEQNLWLSHIPHQEQTVDN